MSKQQFKKPGQWKAYLALTWYAFRAQTRNPASFFFGFIFPLVFISIFGLIGNSSAKITVGIPTTSDQTNPVVQVLKKQQFVDLQSGSTQDLSKELIQGKIAGIVTVQKSTNPKQKYTVVVTTSGANPQNASTIQGLVSGVVDKANLSLSGITTPPISYTQKEVSGRTQRYIDFALPGQLGFSILSTAIFGTVFGLIFLKKALILKRMFATPTRALTILLSQGTSRLIVALAQTILILLVGVLVFKFYLPQGILTFLELTAISAFGLIAFLGFGYLIAGLSNDENAASPLTNLITLPQFLLSGTFFPTDALPKWVQPIANNLPLSYFNAAVRKITTEGGNFHSTIPYLIGLSIWGIIMYVIAARTFKWE